MFIVVGGGANGAYSEEDIIMVEKEALAAAASADRDHLVKARSLRGDHCYQCTVCPRTFQVIYYISSLIYANIIYRIH